MPKILPIQTSFAAGEITPLSQGRVDSEAYRQGLRYCYNWVPEPHGALTHRLGSKAFGTLTSSMERAITFPGRYSFFILLFTSSTMYAYSYDDGAISAESVTFVTSFAHTDSGERAMLTYAWHPEEEKVIIFSPRRDPFEIYYDSVGSVVKYDAISFTSRPTWWGVTAGAFPEVGGFYGGRLYISGSSASPGRIAASKSGSYYDFTTGAADDDALDFYLNHSGKVRWIAGAKDLLLGTDRSEVRVFSNSGEVITPSTVDSRLQSSYGSAKINPVTEGSSIIFVSSDKRRIYETSWDWTNESWSGKELTFGAQHLFNDYTIEEIAYAGSTLDMLFVKDNIGLIKVAKYRKDINSIGWFHLVSQGYHVQVQPITDYENDSRGFFLLTDRDLSSGSYCYEIYGSGFLDSYQDISINGTSITGAICTAGNLATVIGDPEGTPVFLEEVNIDGSGNGTLSESYTGTIRVGFSYTSTLQTLGYVEFTSGVSTLPMKKLWNKIYAYVYNGVPPKINSIHTGETEYDDIKDGEDRVTGLYSCASLGWEQLNRLTIQHDIPFPNTLLAICGESLEEVA